MLLVDADVADIIHYIFLVFPTYGYVSHVCNIQSTYLDTEKIYELLLHPIGPQQSHVRYTSIIVTTNNRLAGIYQIR